MDMLLNLPNEEFNFNNQSNMNTRNTSKNEPIERCTQYVLKGGHYMPMTSTISELPSGYYKPELNHYNGEIYVTPKDIVLPKLYELPNNLHNMVISDIKHFWESEERYKKFGNVYKRNILLYSVPGNGKTSLINVLCQELINEHQGIILSVDDEESLQVYPKLMQKIRQVEPNRKVITIIEDFERLVKKDYLVSLLLQVLDGVEQFNNVVTIATTNYPEEIEKRFSSRPSRFNLIIEYKKPDENVRRFYITQKLIDAGFDIKDEKIESDIEKYTAKTDGYTFDFVKELIQGIYVDEIPEEEMFKRIDAVLKNKGRYQVSEDTPMKVGFNSR